MEHIVNRGAAGRSDELDAPGVSPEGSNLDCAPRAIAGNSKCKESPKAAVPRRASFGENRREDASSPPMSKRTTDDPDRFGSGYARPFEKLTQAVP